jgi:hypothetical protein
MAFQLDGQGGGGFLEGHGSHFPQHDVVIVHEPGTANEARTPSRGIIQANSGQFNIDTPIYEGDIVELPDPRGGTRQLRAREVHVNDVGAGAGPFAASMSHIHVLWGEVRQAPAPRTTVNIHGGSNQLAWDNRDVNQTQGTAWPTDLAEVLRKVIEEADTVDLNPDDRTLLKEDAAAVLTSLEAGEPQTASRRALATVKGILGDLASGVAQGVGQGAVVWAQAALNALAG